MMGVLLFALVELVEKLMIPWHQSRRTVPAGATP
jgi:hypothetical protein